MDTDDSSITNISAASSESLSTEKDILKEFQRIFAPNIDLNIYYNLNADSDQDGSDSVAHIRIEQIVAEINDMSTSSEALSTNSTVLTMMPPDTQHDDESTITPTSLNTTDEPSLYSAGNTSPTSTSSMFAIRTPSPYFLRPPLPITSSADERVTVTEFIEVRRAPTTPNNNNATTAGFENGPIGTATTEDEDELSSQNNNNNTSCSLSSTLTDSRTLDVRTPIVV
ncbi:probable G-protein coupled receptor CG31760 [Teleopsis dalmanni]|uniref:probable G-protein coupled receptor CG31760 n=1 Tax=Teleopsis dalmanni TaxID=139649 RepID=UPI0018CD147A|nr:probable G-protein coupled receptor CG31760 [Teleopsis dalmanni]